MKKGNLFLYLLVFVQTSVAQATYTTDEGATFQFDNVSDGMIIRASTSSGNNIKGSEFLTKEWQQATVYNQNTKKKFRLLARFNAYSREIEAMREKDIISITPVSGVSVKLDNKLFVPLKLTVSPKTIFAEELVKGKMHLYKVYNVKILKAPSDSNLLGLEEEDKVSIIDNLYYREDDGEVLELPSRRKDIETLLNQNTLNYLKSQKLSLKKEEDLIKTIVYYNQNN